jgi:hypothetical protein
MVFELSYLQNAAEEREYFRVLWNFRGRLENMRMLTGREPLSRDMIA